MLFNPKSWIAQIVQIDDRVSRPTRWPMGNIWMIRIHKQRLFFVRHRIMFARANARLLLLYATIRSDRSQGRLALLHAGGLWFMRIRPRTIRCLNERLEQRDQAPREIGSRLSSPDLTTTLGFG